MADISYEFRRDLDNNLRFLVPGISGASIAAVAHLIQFASTPAHPNHMAGWSVGSEHFDPSADTKGKPVDCLVVRSPSPDFSPEQFIKAIDAAVCLQTACEQFTPTQ